MSEINKKAELPACPVETTLTLIGDDMYPVFWTPLKI